MKFGIDTHTKKDLNIFSNYRGEQSVFSFFDKTKTNGGRFLLESLIGAPTNDLKLIAYRSSAIQYIAERDVHFEIDSVKIDFIELYLNQNFPVLEDNPIDSIRNGLENLLRPNNEYFIVSRGLIYLKEQLNVLSVFLNELPLKTIPDFFRELKEEVNLIFIDPNYIRFLNSKQKKHWFWEINRYDNLSRKKEKSRIISILKRVYQLDVFMSVAKTAKEKKLCFPLLQASEWPNVFITGLYHPFLENAVTNDFNLSHSKNLSFVTGANMSGKSTYLKSVGLCVYLSHLGFPVAATSMTISLFNGLISTLNVTDNITKGYSHFYSEVKRVKDTVGLIKEKKRVFVLFDELFRGTNVKDAFEATVAVLSGFTKMKNSLFLISTHIIEVGAELEKEGRTEFRYFGSTLKKDNPVYSYKISEGISSERLGLTIIKNEKLIELINDIVEEIEE